MFPCLRKKLATKLETTVAIIIATAVLYNICRKRNVVSISPDERQGDHDETVQSGGDDGLGTAARRAFIQRHFT